MLKCRKFATFDLENADCLACTINHACVLYKTSSMPKIVAVDFDGTLVEDNYPAIGPKRQDIFDKVLEYRRQGYKLILWTTRHDKFLQAAINYCASEGLYFDAVNDNIPEVKSAWGNNGRKISASIYLDDRNVLP